jgi:hypothetical protein
MNRLLILNSHSATVRTLQSPTEQRPKAKNGAVTILLVIAATFAPYAWILFLVENRDGWIRLWPNLPGMMIALILGRFANSARTFAALPPFISAAMPCATFFLIVAFPRRRRLIVSITFGISCILSLVAYAAYRA